MEFNPDHTVPDTGLRAWAAPDPSQQPVAMLNAGLEVEVVERRGQWAQVKASNGWTGWVDGNLLVARPAPQPEPATQPQPQPEPEPQPERQPEPEQATQAQPAPQPQPEPRPAPAAAPQPEPATQPQPQPQPQPTPQPEPQPAPATTPQPAQPAPVVPRPAPEPPIGQARRWGVGASALLAFATLLDWDRVVDFEFGGRSLSGWDFPLTFLLDFENIFEGTKGVSVGIVLVAVAVVAFAFANSGQAAVVWRVCGGLTLFVGAVFVVQAQRLMSDLDEGWFLDILGPGFYLAMVAGIGLLLAPTRPRESAEESGA